MKLMVAASMVMLALGVISPEARAQDTDTVHVATTEKPVVAFARIVSTVPQGYPWDEQSRVGKSAVPR